MDIILMNSENSKTSYPHKLLFNITDKIDLQRGIKNVALSNLSIYYTWRHIKSSHKNNKFKISAPTWNDRFNLPHWSYSVSDVQDYFEYIIKKHEIFADDPPLKRYINKIENKNTFKIMTGYYVKRLTPETMKLLGSTENKITEDKNGENIPYLEITEVIAVHCNIVINNYQRNSRVLYTFIPNKSFGQLSEISPTDYISSKKFNSDFPYIEVWFTDQNSEPLVIEDRINLALFAT